MSLSLASTHGSHALITAHVDMARKLAQYASCRLPASVSREDLEGAALLGLTEAANRYDTTRQEPFTAYARKRVHGAIQDHLRSIDPMSRNGRRRARRMVEATNRLASVRGRAVTHAEVAEEMGVSEDELHDTIADVHAAATISMEEVAEFATGVSVETLDECRERQRLRTALMRALETLDPRSVKILWLYYLEGLNLREIGELCDITESRVCQLRAEALDILRGQLL